MPGPWEVRPATPADVGGLARLLEQVRCQLLAGGAFTGTGAGVFARYVSAPELALRLKDPGYHCLVAAASGAAAGYLELRLPAHIALLVTSAGVRRRGLARRLLEQALTLVPPGAGPLTVNATPAAVTAYRRLGFQSRGPRQLRDGICFVPMSHCPGDEPTHP